jgi:NAD+ synthase (glutamine-hydrolysing)
MNTLRIALAQINTTVGDFAGNVAKILDGIESAKTCGADLVTFPELAICGYPPEDLLLRPSFLEDNHRALAEIARQSRGIGVVVGFAESAGSKTYNAAAVISDQHVAGTYRKVELPNYGVFDEKRYFFPGSDCLIMQVGTARLAVTICEDIWVEGGLAEQWIAANQTHVTLNISASPFHAGKLAARRATIAAFAKRTGTLLCYNNLVGGQDELVFDGGSMIVNPQGELIANGERFREQLLVTDLEIKENGSKTSRAQTSRECGKRSIVLQPRRPDKRVAPRRAPELGRLEEIYCALVLGTRDYALKNGFKKAVIGLSGGIDSSLTAAIAAEALGTENAIGVTMPSRYTSKGTLSDAETVASDLRIQLITIPIDELFAMYQRVLSEPLGPGKPGVETENLQARIRGTILMTLSNKFGWLVLTTGNKSETAVGYCTLYGDTAGGLAVLKDVPKTLVYELAGYVNEKAGREIIPRSIFKRAPSAELKPNQKDEDSLPPYSVLDTILRAYVEEDRSPGEIASMGFGAEVVHDVVGKVDRSEYKRRQAPPGVKITPKAFGRDRRLPITNRYGIGTPSD